MVATSSLSTKSDLDVLMKTRTYDTKNETSSLSTGRGLIGSASENMKKGRTRAAKGLHDQLMGTARRKSLDAWGTTSNARTAVENWSRWQRDVKRRQKRHRSARELRRATKVASAYDL